MEKVSSNVTPHPEVMENRMPSADGCEFQDMQVNTEPTGFSDLTGIPA